MTGWTETYRGAVPPWQCDTTEHFTVAYYVDRFEEAEANFADELGLGDLLRGRDFVRRLDLRFARELRAGACFHVDSAVIGIEAGPAGHDLRLGHRFVDSVTGEVVTWMDTHWDLSAAQLSPHQHQAVSGRLADWGGPASEPRTDPTSTAGFIPTARGRAKPDDLDATGHFSLSAIVHRFSSANGQAAGAVGMDAATMQQQRRGFSTFEMALKITGALRLDEPYLVETGIGHLGNSSLRLLHRMTQARSGSEVARLSQFGVNLDLDTRRPTKWPEEFRARAAALVVPVG